MQLSSDSINKTCPEFDVFENILSLDNKNILELGCGDATLTRLIALIGEGRSVVATEVDTVQHEKNILVNDLDNVEFLLAGSENIPAKDNSFDVVFMFKSLHHVPIDLMDKALNEIKRVLKTGGLAYISEPIFEGEFNEVLRLFHDEKSVRESAFLSVQRAVNNNQLTLEDEIFFNTPVKFENFEQFENKVIGATHSEHQLPNELFDLVERKFMDYYEKNQGEFLVPIRVDLLKK